MINFSINIFIFLFTKVWMKLCDGFTEYPFAYRFLHHPLPPSFPLNLCVILPLNALDSSVFSTRTIHEEFSLFPFVSSVGCWIFALPLCQSVPIAFSISYSAVHDQHQTPTISPSYRLRSFFVSFSYQRNRILILIKYCRSDSASRN